MADVHHYNPYADSSSNEEKGYAHNVTVIADDDPSYSLHRGLKSRQVAMIAIGGAIGTGLIIGTYVATNY
jgi:yeast amino acid transporter